MIQPLILAVSYGVGLAMDAFAVAICKGLKMQKLNYKQTGLIALFFGGFQAIMPFIGWALGKSFESYINKATDSGKESYNEGLNILKKIDKLFHGKKSGLLSSDKKIT